MENEGTFTPKENLMVPFYANTIQLNVASVFSGQSQNEIPQNLRCLESQRKIGNKARIWETGCLHQLL